MTAPTLLASLVTKAVASRTFQRDTDVFAPSGSGTEVRGAIRNRLGWLSAPTDGQAFLPSLGAFAAEVRRESLTDVYLLGMGGSSLCAEVLRDVELRRSGGTALHVVDTTDERRIRELTDAMDPGRALFIVASKSGSTIEVTALERHFWSVMAAAVADPGRHFVAITDPDTLLAALAAERGYRRTFVNAADIGGRFSALSFFGLVPAALIGLDLPALLSSARQMADRCRLDAPDNPGLALGAFMAEASLAGCDKLTLLLPPAVAPLGPWIEQLVAESTGKEGRGVLPVVGEPVGRVRDYGPDRAFVAMSTDPASAEGRLLAALEADGRRVFRIEGTAADLGGEFFRWEMATAVAGVGLGVNPFDEPNVRSAKASTQAQLDARRSRGAFVLNPPLERGDGYSRREHRTDALAEAGPQRYVAILDYLPSDPRRADVIERLRGVLRQRTGLATTHGVGPRYLHSTGQFHKGGPNVGLFLLMTATDASATPVPGTDYTFSILKQAQALGDFDALVAAGRNVMHYHLDDPSADAAEALERVLRSLT